jgi:hypothetical protein
MMRALVRSAALPALVLVASCASDPGLPAATVPVHRQVIQLTAPHGNTASNAAIRAGYNMFTLSEVDILNSLDLDFLFDLRASSNAATSGLDTTVALLVPVQAGVQPSALPFDAISAAPLEGYTFNVPVPINPGEAVIVASRPQRCTTVGVESPRYAKLLIEAIDRVAGTATIVVAINPNCGYRSLAPGIPAF